MSKEAADLNIKERFPVIERQWAAVSEFRSQIVQKASNHLQQVDQADQVTIFNSRIL